MTARDVLMKAKQIALRDHVAGHLAVSATGRRCKPASAVAVRWSSTGAVCKVDWDGNPGRWSGHGDAGWNAFELLCTAAYEHGYACVHHVDVAGAEQVARMFERAIDMAAEADEAAQRHRGKHAARGSQPRGHAVV